MPTTRRASAASHLVSGAAGGIAVFAIAGVLVGTGVISANGRRREIIREVPAAAPLRGADGKSRSVADIYRRAAPGVVFIQARVMSQASSPFGFPLEQQGQATGSGLVLDKRGYILTNAHVVAGARTVGVRFDQGEALIKAKLVGQDLSTDIAVLKVDARAGKLHPLPLGNSDRVRVGDPAIAIGNPFGYDRTVTTGIISALQRQITAPNGFAITHVIQTDAPINPGNSGGPLLDSAGKVIGINSQIATAGSRGSVGIGFAVPINTAKRVVPQLEQSGRIEHAYLGVTSYALDKDLAAALGLPVDRGALVQSVLPGGAAARAGIRAGRVQTDQGVVLGGDIIVEVDGHKVAKPADVGVAISEKKPGDVVEVKFYRGGKVATLQAKLGVRPSSFSQTPSVSPDQGGGLALP